MFTKDNAAPAGTGNGERVSCAFDSKPAVAPATSQPAKKAAKPPRAGAAEGRA